MTRPRTVNSARGLGINKREADAAEWQDLLAFEIRDEASELRGDYHGNWPSSFRPHLAWKTKFLEPLLRRSPEFKAERSGSLLRASR